MRNDMNTFKIIVAMAVLVFMTDGHAAVYLMDEGKKPQDYVVGSGVPALKGWQVKIALERMPPARTETDTVVCTDFRDCLKGAAAFCERRGSEIDQVAYGLLDGSKADYPMCVATCIDDHLGSAPCKVITSEDIKKLASDPATQRPPEKPLAGSALQSD